VARLPQRLDDLTTRIEQGRVAVQNPRLERRMGSLERTARRVISAVLFAALFIGGAVVRADDVVFGTVLMVVAVVPLLHSLLAGWVSRRLP
jgi:hypothetical protein